MRTKDAETLAEVQRRSYANAHPPRTTWPEESALDAVGLQSFLERVRYAVLATGRSDGRPLAAPVGFLVEDGGFWVATVRGARLRNVRALPWASLVVMEDVTAGGDETRTHTAVTVEGPVRIHEDEALDTVRGCLERRWRERYYDPPDWAVALLEIGPERLFSYSTSG
ncbi:MAG: pyridoxamine 5'-phosphate oxidase family protein [Solirubrobacteraceae bacterium MAG38_C4-C5]|nr:pyridoxamine 5'-phosphate oxidase family protein [Candidatus Siliceabacter maunaloa]